MTPDAYPTPDELRELAAKHGGVPVPGPSGPGARVRLRFHTREAAKPSPFDQRPRTHAFHVDGRITEIVHAFNDELFARWPALRELAWRLSPSSSYTRTTSTGVRYLDVPTRSG